MDQNNPLRQYFRQPVIYVRLPSNGEFYPQGAIEIPENREFPVYPMTAIDEITYRTPDALFNGQAVVSVIESCIPAIKNGWAVPTTDMDTILIAIRIASYGHEMDFSTQCPKCNEVTDQAIDLRSVLDTLKAPDYKKPIQYGDIEIYFKPMTYKNYNENNQLQFESQRAMQVVPADDTSDEANRRRLTIMGEALKKLTEITIHTLVQSIAVIRTPGALVNEPEYISEFLTNCDRKLFNQIKDHIIKIKEVAELQPVNLTCPDCQHQYTQPLTLDMTSFFEPAS